MTFASPIAFLLLLFLPIVWRIHNSKVEKGFSASTFIPLGELPVTLKELLFKPILTILLTASFICLVVALARPQNVSEVVEAEETGRDIMLLLDLSGSMKALDFFIDGKRVDRLEALKYVTTRFIKERVGDRMGLIVFGDHAFTQCPLTLDHDVLISFVEKLEVGIAGQGTAIGDALAISLKRLKEIDADSRVIVLVTDGKNTSGTLSTRQGAELARMIGIKIHAIGIGGNRPAPYPFVDAYGRTRIIQQVFQYDEAALKEIATITGGESFNAVDIEALQAVYKRLDELESRKDMATHYFQYQELYEPFLFIALAALLLYQLLLSTVFVRVP